MKTQHQTGLFWFRHDLRLADNAALHAIARQCESLLCVYVVDPRWFRADQFQSAPMGEQRWAFEQESLLNLQASLAELGQRLLVVKGDPVAVLVQLIQQCGVTLMGSSHHPGTHECRQWQALAEACPFSEFEQRSGHTLFEQVQLPFTVADLPNNFTPFRKQVEDIAIDRPLRAPDHLPSPTQRPLPASESLVEGETRGDNIRGGLHAGMQQLAYYLHNSDLIKQYKLTRNGLDGWDYSSKLSPWLANGSLSARQVLARLRDYEAERGSNESTYWLYFELLWREYFQWYLQKHDTKLFRFDGVRGKKPLTSFWPQRFKAWCEGSTPYPIVNACMRQLNATGFMSNRGRQLVASALVHELQLDWRYGAAYFEQQLVDFDVASNWGNWQYLAGVGADPRGHRRFDLAKQARQYDPHGEFVACWDGKAHCQPLDQVDHVDWPISWQ